MPNGILVIDKPQGWTSMDVCAKLRGILRERRIGHAGTLDPMATGVLPVFMGRATRAVAFASESEKEYIAGLKLGVITNTQDITGEVLERRPVTAGRAELEEAMSRFRGEISQIPPMYSAVKIGGKKLYELARKGQEVERKARRITIFTLEALEPPREGGLDERMPEEGEFLLRVRCSKGTYVRTLCHDIGAALGCGGAMSSLRRTMAAGFTLEEAVTLEAVQRAAQAGEAEGLLLPVDRYFERNGWTGRLTVGPADERNLRNGAPVGASGAVGNCRVYSEGGEFLALARCGGGRAHILRRFYEV